jgi:hypothetical protein
MLLSIEDEQNESMEDNDEEYERESCLPIGKNKDGRGGRVWDQCRDFDKDPRPQKNRMENTLKPKINPPSYDDTLAEDRTQIWYFRLIVTIAFVTL